MTRRTSVRTLFTALIAVPALFVVAQMEGTAPSAKAKVDAASFKAGKAGKGSVTLTFADGWHGYQNPPSNEFQIPVKLESLTKDVAIKVAYPKGVEKELMGEKTAVYEGAVTFPFTFTAPKKPGTYKVKLKVSYQQCNDQSCLPPGTITLEVPVKVVK